MKVTKLSAVILFITFFSLLCVACNKEDKPDLNSAVKDDKGVALNRQPIADSFLCGSWAYTHDMNKAIAVFREDGTATYEGKEYSCTYDEQFISLESADDDTVLNLRYELVGDDMLIYKQTEYAYMGENEPDSLVGLWSDSSDRWTFEFKDDRTFMEDGFFTGIYLPDYDNSVVKLMYNEDFEDTRCYFVIEGKSLFIEYPWLVRKMK